MKNKNTQLCLRWPTRKERVIDVGLYRGEDVRNIPTLYLRRFLRWSCLIRDRNAHSVFGPYVPTIVQELKRRGEFPIRKKRANERNKTCH